MRVGDAYDQPVSSDDCEAVWQEHQQQVAVRHATAQLHLAPNPHPHTQATMQPASNTLLYHTVTVQYKNCNVRASSCQGFYNGGHVTRKLTHLGHSVHLPCVRQGANWLQLLPRIAAPTT
jgi:hypothetical protein